MSDRICDVGFCCHVNCTRCDPPAEEIDACRRWLREHVEPAKTVSLGSYFLKHRVEEWVGFYISNGALILAAIAEGYSVAQRHKLNAVFAMKMKKRTKVAA